MLRVRAYTKGEAGTTGAPQDFELVEPQAAEPAPVKVDPYQGYADDESTRRVLPAEALRGLLHRMDSHGPAATSAQAQQSQQLGAHHAQHQAPITTKVGSDSPGVPPVASPYYRTATAQARREVFYRQANLAKEMSRMGMPPLVNWGTEVRVGKLAVPPGGSWADSRAAAAQQASHNPILMHERKVKPQMARQAGPGRQAAGLSAIPDEWEPVVQLMAARLLAVDGMRYTRMEGVPVEARRCSTGSAPSNEAQGGDLSVARARQWLEAQQQGLTKGTGKRRAADGCVDVRTQLAKELAHLQQSGVGLGVLLPTSAASQAAPQQQQQEEEVLPQDQPAGRLRAAKPHPAPQEITRINADKPGSPSAVLYPVTRRRAGHQALDRRGLPLPPDQLKREATQENAVLMTLGAYASEAYQPANEVVHAHSRGLSPQLVQQQQQQQPSAGAVPAVQGSTSVPAQGAAPDVPLDLGLAPTAAQLPPSTPVIAQPVAEQGVNTTAAAAPAAAAATTAAAPATTQQRQPTPGLLQPQGHSSSSPASPVAEPAAGLPELDRFQDVSSGDEEEGGYCVVARGGGRGGAGSSSDDESWGVASAEVDGRGFPLAAAAAAAMSAGAASGGLVTSGDDDAKQRTAAHSSTGAAELHRGQDRGGGDRLERSDAAASLQQGRVRAAAEQRGLDGTGWESDLQPSAGSVHGSLGVPHGGNGMGAAANNVQQPAACSSHALDNLRDSVVLDQRPEWGSEHTRSAGHGPGGSTAHAASKLQAAAQSSQRTRGERTDGGSSILPASPGMAQAGSAAVSRGDLSGAVLPAGDVPIGARTADRSAGRAGDVQCYFWPSKAPASRAAWPHVSPGEAEEDSDADSTGSWGIVDAAS